MLYLEKSALIKENLKKTEIVYDDFPVWFKMKLLI